MVDEGPTDGSNVKEGRRTYNGVRQISQEVDGLTMDFDK